MFFQKSLILNLIGNIHNISKSAIEIHNIALNHRFGSKIIENNWRNTSKTQYIGYNHNDVCCICLNDLIGRNAKTVLQCKHIFHKDCIKKWNDFSNACPICKAVH